MAAAAAAHRVLSGYRRGKGRGCRGERRKERGGGSSRWSRGRRQPPFLWPFAEAPSPQALPSRQAALRAGGGSARGHGGSGGEGRGVEERRRGRKRFRRRRSCGSRASRMRDLHGRALHLERGPPPHSELRSCTPSQLPILPAKPRCGAPRSQCARRHEEAAHLAGSEEGRRGRGGQAREAGQNQSWEGEKRTSVGRRIAPLVGAVMGEKAHMCTNVIGGLRVAFPPLVRHPPEQFKILGGGRKRGGRTESGGRPKRSK
jgi:hypothetical protein